MLKLAAVQAALTASVILASKGRCKGKRLAIKILSSALLSCVTYCVFYFLSFDSFMVPVASGQLCCLSADLIIGRKDSVFPSFCLFLCTDCAFVPLEMGGKTGHGITAYTLRFYFCSLCLHFLPKEKNLPTRRIFSRKEKTLLLHRCCPKPVSYPRSAYFDFAWKKYFRRS